MASKGISSSTPERESSPGKSDLMIATARSMARVFAAIDTPDLARARDLATTLAGRIGGLKLGLEFFSANGAAGVAEIAGAGLPIFLDLKFHDIPNTVAAAVRAVAPLAPAILNVHAAGGPAMMQAARAAAHDAAARLGHKPPKLIAVTVLTSLGDTDLAATGQQGPALEQVRRLAGLTQECGLDGVVCSAQEIAALRAQCGEGFLLVAPGIRPLWAAAGDQKRIMTPGEAISKGADYLVIGRPITESPDPVAAAQRIAAEIAAASATAAERRP